MVHMTIEINEQIARHIHHLEGLLRHLNSHVIQNQMLLVVSFPYQAGYWSKTPPGNCLAISHPIIYIWQNQMHHPPPWSMDVVKGYG